MEKKQNPTVKKASAKKKLKRNIGIILAVVLVVLFAGFAAVFHYFNKVQESVKLPEEPGSIVPQTDRVGKPDEDLVDVLIMGVDASERLTDVLVVARYNIKDNTVKLLQIPRDTYVGNEFPTGKINAVFGHPRKNMSGIQTLRAVLHETMSLDIDYYVTFTIPMLRKIVNEMGGVTVDVPVPIVWSNGKRIEPGVQVLDGAHAEMFMRYRAGYAMGDIGRVNAQRLFFMGLFDRAKELGKVKCLGILTEVYSEFKTDMPLTKAASFANAAFDLESENIEFLMLPGEGRMVGGFSVFVCLGDKYTELLNTQFKTAGEEDYVVDLPQPNADVAKPKPPKNDNPSSSTAKPKPKPQPQPQQPSSSAEPSKPKPPAPSSSTAPEPPASSGTTPTPPPVPSKPESKPSIDKDKVQSEAQQALDNILDALTPEKK